jgi:L-ascorbate metabolism protein UlaG (beta-lactamase superfamily)
MKKLRMKWIGLLAALIVGSGLRPATAQEPTLTWLGHAAFKYTTRQGLVILIDPWISNPKAPKNVSFKHIEAILITHAHSDHVGEAFDLAKKFNAPIVAPNELTQIALKHGVKKVFPLDISGSTEVAGVKITAVQAVHGSGFIDGDAIVYAGSAVGYILEEYGSATLYHAGDTGVFEDMNLISRLYQPQVAMLPIGGVYTMNPVGAALAAQLIGAKTVIPMHFGTFPALTGTPTELKKEMVKLNLPYTVRELTPGVEMKIKDLM